MLLTMIVLLYCFILVILTEITTNSEDFFRKNTRFLNALLHGNYKMKFLRSGKIKPHDIERLNLSFVINKLQIMTEYKHEKKS